MNITIFTPYKLSDEQLNIFLNKFSYLKGKEVKNQIDKALIGGFIIKTKTKIFDVSIKGAIDKLTNRLYEKF